MAGTRLRGRQWFRLRRRSPIFPSLRTRGSSSCLRTTNGEFQVIHANVNNYWQGRWIKHPAQCNLCGCRRPSREMLTGLIDALTTRNRRPLPTTRTGWSPALGARSRRRSRWHGRKYHTTDASNMSIDWLGPRLYKPSLDEVLAGALGAVYVGRPLHRRFATDARRVRRTCGRCSRAWTCASNTGWCTSTSASNIQVRQRLRRNTTA